MSKAPFNISILDPDEDITSRQLLPVTTSAIFEPSTTRFHPNGLYSEVIFGQVGSTERLVRRGYIELRCDIITPHLYKQLMSLKGYYEEIMSGKTYAYFDEELQDFIKCTPDDPKAQTGYTFFMNHVLDIVYTTTNSTKRQNKIDLIHKYKQQLKVSRLIILPAGIRDVKFEDGHAKSEEINKLYTSLLALTKALPEQISTDTLYDGIRFQIQSKVQEIYEYIANMLDGKGGFGQSKYAARNITYGTRNVITACILSRTSDADSPDSLNPDEVELPLFQTMKGATPLVVHKLKTIFFEQIFSTNNRIALINRKTLEMNYVNISTDVLNRFTTAKGLEELINEFSNSEWLYKPATVPATDDNGKQDDYYLYLVSDKGKDIFTLRSKSDFMDMITHPSVVSNPAIDIDLSIDCVIVMQSALDLYGDLEHTNVFVLIRDNDYAKELERIGGESKDNYFNLPCLRLDEHLFAYSEESLRKLGLDTNDIFNTAIDTNHGKVQDIKTFKPIALQKELFLKTHNKILDEVFGDANIRPMTWLELGYLACYSATKDKHSTATRYPILNFEGLALNKIHLMSTQPSRVVTVRFHGGGINSGVVLPEYPRLDATIKTSMSVHPATLDAYDGDHDGVHL